MLIVKVMSSEDTHDTDPRKGFMLHAGVIEAHFERIPDDRINHVVLQRLIDGTIPPTICPKSWLTLRFSRKTNDREVDDAISFEPQGNVYVMNERGTTIASYSPNVIEYAA